MEDVARRRVLARRERLLDWLEEFRWDESRKDEDWPTALQIARESGLYDGLRDGRKSAFADLEALERKGLVTWSPGVPVRWWPSL